MKALPGRPVLSWSILTETRSSSINTCETCGRRSLAEKSRAALHVRRRSHCVVRIRPATTADAAAIAGLATELGYPSSHEEMTARLERLLRSGLHFTRTQKSWRPPDMCAAVNRMEAVVVRRPTIRVRTLCSVLCLLALAQACQPRHSPAHPPIDVHQYVVQVHQPPWTTDLAPDARVVPLERSVVGSDSTISPDGRWRAFLIESPDEPGGRICIETVSGGQRGELRGLPLPYRPLSALVWLDAEHLAFDRWSQPHYGIHYVLNVRLRRLILAAPFPDTVGTSRRAHERPRVSFSLASPFRGQS